MPPLRVRRTDGADGAVVMRRERADGSAPWQRHEGRDGAYFPFTFVNSTTVVIGGTDIDNPGTSYAFRAIDNGSSGSPADQITLPQNGQACATFTTLGNWSLTGGADASEVRGVRSGGENAGAHRAE